MNICYAHTDQEIENVRLIFNEHFEELLKIDTCFENFENELRDLPGEYSEPDGALLLVEESQTVIGCAALKKVDAEICEMKRLFIRPEFRGQGRGRELVYKIIEEAINKGYSKMRLDTLDSLEEANVLYKSLGFQRISPYLEDTSVEHVYWSINLKNSSLAPTQ